MPAGIDDLPGRVELFLPLVGVLAMPEQSQCQDIGPGLAEQGAGEFGNATLADQIGQRAGRAQFRDLEFFLAARGLHMAPFEQFRLAGIRAQHGLQLGIAVLEDLAVTVVVVDHMVDGLFQW